MDYSTGGVQVSKADYLNQVLACVGVIPLTISFCMFMHVVTDDPAEKRRVLLAASLLVMVFITGSSRVYRMTLSSI